MFFYLILLISFECAQIIFIWGYVHERLSPSQHPSLLIQVKDKRLNYTGNPLSYLIVT